jgi:hypothetical protein
MTNVSSMTSNMTKLAESLAENLPTREDVINAIGLATRRSSASELSTVIGAFGAGMLIGAGLALLFAPRTGEELRREIGERVSSFTEGEPSGQSTGGETTSYPRSAGGGTTGATSFGTSPAAGTV